MADRVLRDHCDHGRYEAHGEFTSQIVRNDKDELITESETTWCPGGREVTARPIVQTSQLADTFHGASNGDRVDGWLISDG